MKQEQPPIIMNLIKKGMEDGSFFLSSHDS